jgi:hypothetical protein
VAANPEEIKKNWLRLKANKANWDNSISQMLEYLCPRKTNRIQGRKADGTKQTDKQFDSAGENAGQLLASTMAGTMSSAAAKWFGLVPRDSSLKKMQQVIEWLEECADRLYAAFNNRPSNFAAEMGEVYLDLVYIGTAAILMEEAKIKSKGFFGGFRFRALDFGEYWISEDPYGRVNTLYREFELTYDAMFRQWGPAIGVDALNQYADNKYNIARILHAVYPRNSYDQRKQDYSNMPFASCYVLQQNNHLVAEGGFPEFPYAVGRWTKSPGEIYGRSPGHQAYPDVRTQNRLVELELEAGSKAVDPPLLQLYEGILGDTTLNPAGINYVDPSYAGGDVRNVIAPLESGSKFEWARERLERLEKKIRQAFFNDHLDMPMSDRMSATEFAGRQEIMQRVIGPTMGRVQGEIHAVIVDRGFNIMMRAGAMPPPPPILQQYAGADIDITFEGPLARSQRATDLVAIQRKNDWLLTQIQLGNTDAVDNFSSDEEAQEIAFLTGLPSNILRDSNTRNDIRAKRAAAQQQNEALMKMGAVAEGVGKAGGLQTLPRTAQALDMGLSGANPRG